MTSVNVEQEAWLRSSVAHVETPNTNVPLRLCLWTRLPNHYQRALVGSLDQQCDLRVVYFAKVPAFRIALGWENDPSLSDHEFRCASLDEALQCVPDWKERIHIVPGYGGPFQRGLARHLSAHGVPWADWSESSSPGFRWYARLPVKLWWTHMVSRQSIGSFAIGSQAEDDFVRRGISRAKIAYLPYSSSCPDSPARPDIDTLMKTEGKKTFLFLGTLSRRKGVDILLRAARRVLPLNPGWMLVLVGNDTRDQRFQKMALEFGIASQVVFRGPVSPSEIPALVAAADVLVLPSRYDGWGLAINEGAAGGLAIIASNTCGAARHLVIPGYNGFRVKARSISELAHALGYYTACPGLSAQHGTASRLLARDIAPDLNAARMLSTISTWMAMRPTLRHPLANQAR